MIFNLQDGTKLSNDISCINQDLGNGWRLIEVGIIQSGKTHKSIYYRIKPKAMSTEYYVHWSNLLTRGRSLYSIKDYKPAPDVEIIEETEDIKRVEILQTYGNILLIKLTSNSKNELDVFSFGKERIDVLNPLR